MKWALIELSFLVLSVSRRNCRAKFVVVSSTTHECFVAEWCKSERLFVEPSAELCNWSGMNSYSYAMISCNISEPYRKWRVLLTLRRLFKMDIETKRTMIVCIWTSSVSAKKTRCCTLSLEKFLNDRIHLRAARPDYKNIDLKFFKVILCLLKC